MSARMESMPVWFHCHGAEQHLSAQQIASALAREGVSCQRRGGSLELPCGLILFEKEAPDLIDLVQDYSRNGFDRVLLVGIRKSALTGGTPWKLMQAGASDV